MNQKEVSVGIDVDDVQYHGSALDRQTGEVLSFQCRPTLKGLIGQLENVRKYFGGAALKVCYEALLLAGKHPNKVKVMCAREMVGFVWESLNLAAAA